MDEPTLLDEVIGIPRPPDIDQVRNLNLQLFTFGDSQRLHLRSRTTAPTSSTYISIFQFSVEQFDSIQVSFFHIRSFLSHSKRDDTPISGTTSTQHTAYTPLSSSQKQLGIIFTCSHLHQQGSGTDRFFYSSSSFSTQYQTTGFYFLLQ